MTTEKKWGLDSALSESRSGALLRGQRPKLGAIFLSDANIDTAVQLLHLLSSNYKAWRDFSDGQLYELSEMFHAIHVALYPITCAPADLPTEEWQALSERLRAATHAVPDEAYSCFCDLIARLPTIEIEQALLKGNAAKAGKSRWVDDPTQTLKRAIETEWAEWQSDRARYRWPRDFRTAMANKYPGVVDGTLKNWMSEWGKPPRSPAATMTWGESPPEWLVNCLKVRTAQNRHDA